MSEEKARAKAFNEYSLKINDKAYYYYNGRYISKVKTNYDLETVKRIIEEGDPAELREVSRFFARVSGIYKTSLYYYSNLSLYDYVVTPLMNKQLKEESREKFIGYFNKVLSYVDSLNLQINLPRIFYSILSTGIYYGILIEEGSNYTFQDLPIGYCRSRFKNSYGIDILEFDLKYFMNIYDDNLRNAALENYPPIIRRAFKKYEKGLLTTSWIEIPPEFGGICFYYLEPIPYFVSSIPSIIKLEEATEREAKRDENELYKLLIQKMPIGKNDELVFELPEVYEIHDSIAEMLAGIDTIDVLTTFGDTTLESVQDSTAATQSLNRIEKYKNSTYDNLGLSYMLFNSDSSSAIPYSIEKDESIVRLINNIFSAWINYQINLKFSKSNLKFSFNILPTTIHNREKLQKQYFSGAQYGYSKIFAGVALGIKQSEMINLLNFENDILSLSEKMVPLQSSFTSTTNQSGRPQLDLDDKSEKTQKNLESS